ncbi:MAG TPA: hypothetical protein VEI04_13055, partial [Syntrophobacteria bacterium]|nr:hypothetical protein [Syntrophobacteria bacterium]
MKRAKRSVILLCSLLILFALPGLLFAEGLTWGPEEIPVEAWLPVYRDFSFTATETQGQYVLRLEVEKAGRLIGAVVSNGEWHFLLGKYFAAGGSIDWKVTLTPKNTISLLLLSTVTNRLSL